MLFFNFLCLFYLMVLINSHTISKNVAYDTFDDIVDSINELDYIRGDTRRHDRLVHNYRKEEKQEETTKAKQTTTPKIKVATLVPDVDQPKVTTTTFQPIEKKTKPKFWNKFRNRLGYRKNTARRNEVYKRKAGRSKKHHLRPHNKDFLEEFDFDSSKRIADYNNENDLDLGKRKREAATTVTVNPRSTSSKIFNRLTSKLDTTKLSPVRTYRPATGNDITQTLNALTTRLTDLKHTYGMTKYRTSPFSSLPEYKSAIKNWSNVTSSVATMTTAKTTEDVDFLGTAQIEALLNDIKAKAVKMVADQNPAVTDIITNTVTETTFEVDPMLTHMAISSPGFAISTFISIDGPYSERSVPKVATPRSDSVVISNTEPHHNIHERSLGEDVYTIAQNIEDMLQKEMQRVYHKVKNKLSTQISKEVHEAKKTAKKKLDKVTKEISKTCPTSVTKPMTTPKRKKTKHPPTQKQRRAPKNSKYPAKTKTTRPTTQSTYDDYLMLTLFEQMLAKTHEDNVMKMLSTTEASVSNKRNYFRRMRSDTEAAGSANDSEKVYDDMMPIELLDYNSKSMTSTEMPYSDSTESVTDTSFEGLSNKICYNDYVNGYKHYLKFQREQGNQNFSNLIKYQAHRHHSVDEIGKFILDKIPQLPTRRKKRFFDDDIMEDQDISTKSDDSWFKKHFYLFIDNGPPRKYHTSQTVELKSPITEPVLDMVNSEKSMAKLQSKSKSFIANSVDKSVDEDGEMNLDSLSKSLDDIKVKQFSNVGPEDLTTRKVDRNHNIDSGNNLFRASMEIVDKLFGSKSGRTVTQHNLDLDGDSYISANKMEREKRNPKERANEARDLANSPITTIKSTIAAVMSKNKNGYVDVDLIPRPTAIVKLRANKERKSKLKKFFNKFRFRKRNRQKDKEVKNKSHKIGKREQRVQRFNPLKKLKDIFQKNKVQEKTSEGYDIPDYEMVTSHIDTFKPVKYNKVPSIEEIKGQIPNITEERHIDSIIKHDQYSAHDLLKETDKPLSFDMPFDVPVVPEVYETTPLSIINDTTVELSPVTGLRTTSSTKSLRPYTSTKKTSKLKPSDRSSRINSEINDSMFTTVKGHFNDNYDYYHVTPTPSLSLEDIRNEVEGIQMKLSMPPTLHKQSTQTVTTKKPSPVISTRLMSNYIVNRKMYVPPHLKYMAQLKHPKIEPKDLKIQTKLTRIAKFPLSHFHSNKINPVLEHPEIANQNINLKKRTIEGTDIRANNLIAYDATESPKFFSLSGYSEGKYDRYKPYPDYFNDLLMWHGDLLNIDKVTSPQWESILKSVKQDAEVTTHSMQDMQRELAQMRESLGFYRDLNLPKSTPRFKLKAIMPLLARNDKYRANINPKDYIKTVAVKDNAVAKTKDVVIQGEAKYYQMMKQPDLNTDKYIQADDLITNLNKLHFKNPGIKYNIEEKIREVKHNDGLWKTDYGTKNENSKDEDGNSVLFLDTTLLAYDDGPNFITEQPKLKHKKMSKTSKPYPTQQSTVKPITKTNASPLQYFSTPLPMKMNDFDRFLKDHQIDVQSVTSPLLSLPQYNLVNKGEATSKLKDSKTESTRITHKTTALIKGKKVHKKPVEEYFNNILINDATPGVVFTTKSHSNVDKSVINKYLEDLDDKRRKRYSELLNDRFFTFEPFKRKPKGKVKKTKIIEKKQQLPESTTEMFTDITPYNPSDDVQNEVELTIINMNDMDTRQDKVTHKDVNQKSKKPNKTSKSTTTAADTDEKKSSAPLMKKVHNQLLFDHYISKEKSGKGKASKADDSEEIMPDDAKTSFHPFIDSNILNRLHSKNHPKRVKISSHSYKYDIIYNNNDQVDRRFNKNVVRKYKHNYGRKPLRSYSYDEYYKQPFNSDFIQNIRKFNRGSQIIKIVNAVEAIENFTRPDVEIHVDLPTYYMPDTGPTEKIVFTTQKSWNEIIMKYISGIALIDLLNRFGLLTMLDGKLNLTDGVDKAVNACKVFSITERSTNGMEVKRNDVTRKSRQVSFSKDSVDSQDADLILSSLPNWREKRRLKIFSNIRGKLKTLLRRNKPTSTTEHFTNSKTMQETTKEIENTISEDHKPKREKKFEPEDGVFRTTVGGFRVDLSGINFEKLVKVTAAEEEKKLSSENSFLERAKIQTEAEKLLNNDGFPDLNALENWREKGKVHFSLPPITTETNATNELPLETTTKRLEPLTASISPKKSKTHHSNEEVYFEPLLEDKQIYYEPGTSQRKPVSQTTIKSKSTSKIKGKSSETKVLKRELQSHGSYTAKDVAALEVIVDLVRNAAGYEEQEGAQAYTDSFYMQHLPSTTVATTTYRPVKSTAGTNSIQVHIAIPYNLQMDKKRSLDPLRVRRVFAAKMLTPVDLEYQVQSIDDNIISRSTPVNFDMPRPKMYLLIDTNGSLAHGNFTLQPVVGKVDLSNVKARQADTTKAFSQKVETTSHGKNLGLGKVTLSKDFVAAVNKHLVQLYENLTAINETGRHKVKARSVYDHADEGMKVYRRHINWEAVKKYFGHDRVCHCKCKPNKTMCRACAASDAVVSELIYEIDNLNDYMKEHCTEIQTFFWMNPSGGKKLRDSVQRVDQTLRNYYKRVKGKCQGRTCNTFSTCIDRRSLVKKKKMPRKYLGDPLIVDMQLLAKDIDTASKMNMCFTDNIVEEGEALINTIGNCIRYSRESGVTMTTHRQKYVKSMYSLDNINVNIICKPDSKAAVATTAKLYPSSTIVNLAPNTEINYMPTHMITFDYEPLPVKAKKKFRLFGNKKLQIGNYKMNDLFTYYVTKDEVTPTMRMFKKRQADNEPSLRQTTMSAFWRDYFRGKSQKMLAVVNDRETSTLTTTLRDNSHKTSLKSDKVKLTSKKTTIAPKETILTTTVSESTKKHVFQRNVNTTDYSSVETLTHNMNELFKIFHNITDLQEIENLTTLYPKKPETKKTTKQTCKPKTRITTKTTKVIKKLTNKFQHKPKPKVTTPCKDIPSVPEPCPTMKSDSDSTDLNNMGNEINSNEQTTPIPSIPSTYDTTTESVPITTKKATTTVAATNVITAKTTKKKTTTEKKKESTTTKKKTVLTTSSPKIKTTTTPKVTTITTEQSAEPTTEMTEVTKSNFFDKIKTATLDFFHNRLKSLRKEGTTTINDDDIRKSRSPTTNNLNSVMNDTSLEENPKTSSDILKDGGDLEFTTINSPTILIINDYDTENTNFDEDFSDAKNSIDFGNFEKPEREIEVNLRNLLLSILDFEAKKISTERKRLKKEYNEMDRYSFETGTESDNINIYTLELNSDRLSETPSANCDYDIIKKLKSLELPAPTGLEQKKPVGLLQKIVNKFGVRVVSTPGLSEKVPVPIFLMKGFLDGHLEYSKDQRPPSPPQPSQPPLVLQEPPLVLQEPPLDQPESILLQPEELQTQDQLQTETDKAIFRSEDTPLTTQTAPRTTKKEHPMQKITFTKEKIVVNVGPEETKKPEETVKRKETTKPTTKRTKPTTKKTKPTTKRTIHRTTPSKITTTAITTTKAADTTKEVVESIPGKRLCDIGATFKRVLRMQRTMSKKEFERFVANLSCFKYKNPPKNFLIKAKGKKVHKKRNKMKNVSTESIKWDWIRNKRSLDNQRDFKTTDNLNMNHNPYLYNIYEKTTKKYGPSTIKVTVKTVANGNTEMNSMNFNFNSVENNHQSWKHMFQNDIKGTVIKKINPFKYKSKPKKKLIVKINNKGTTMRPIDFNDTVQNKFDDTSNNKHYQLLNDVNFVVNDDDYFEPFDKDEFGIYRSRRKRMKRNPGGIRDLEAVLRDLPYGGEPNESYAMVGDSVIIYCAASFTAPESAIRHSVTWRADRGGLLAQGNVNVQGPKIFIKDVGVKNLGVYTCQRGESEKSVKLVVITLPMFKVGVTPVYALDKNCFYEDLRAIKALGPQMSRACCASSDDPAGCSVEVQEPICLEDRLDKTTYVRTTAVMTLRARSGVRCSGKCRRDLHNSMALLTAANVPVLASIRVLLSSDGMNKSLIPTWSAKTKRTIVTHTLRRKEVGVPGIRFRVPDLPPGSVSFVALCPAGYYLVSAQKICVACPVGTTSHEGQNVCVPEPTATPLGQRSRRCQWWWYPGYGYCAACWVVLALAAAAAVAHSRRPRGTRHLKDRGLVDGRTRAQPSSPSRVILAKFFRASHSSTRVTDSQETKFGLWKEKHSPPPLPPIDFDF